MVTVQLKADITYATIEDDNLTLDLHLPVGVEDAPVVAYFHGGGWQLGDKADGAEARLSQLASRGIAVASVNYRLAPAAYPAPVHDVKAAIRWIRSHGAEYGLASTKVGAWGASAGAYLASMLGLTAGDDVLEGDVGDDVGVSSAVDAVVHWFGPSHLVTNTRRTWIEQALLNPPFELALLGVEDADAAGDLAAAASPLTRVHAQAPPFLIAHGDVDRITPASESEALHRALTGNGVDSMFLEVGGAGHEDPRFDGADVIAITAAFLRSHLT